jgi:hypothetical protein
MSTTKIKEFVYARETIMGRQFFYKGNVVDEDDEFITLESDKHGRTTLRKRGLDVLNRRTVEA